MKKILIAGGVLVLVIACSKDKFQTNPQISIKSTSSMIVQVNQPFTVTLSYTDKEGDISDTMFINKIRLNKTVVTTSRDTIKYKIPDFPNYDKGEISVAMNYVFDLVSANMPPPIVGSNPSQPQPDTLLIKFWIHDKAGHVSDTVSTGPVIVMR